MEDKAVKNLWRTPGGARRATQTFSQIFTLLFSSSSSPVFFVDLVTEADRVDDRQLQLNVALL